MVFRNKYPLNHLPIHIRVDNEFALEPLDAYIGDWYEAGFNGAFGEPGKKGMLHEIYNFERVDENTVMFYVDCGRARLDALVDFINRLELFHQQYPIIGMLIGRGFLSTA